MTVNSVDKLSKRGMRKYAFKWSKQALRSMYSGV